VTRPLVRFALLACCAAALLAGCGRKGALDPPPSAQLAAPGTAEKAPEPEPAMDINGQPKAPPGPKKHIFLDNLID
jgi:predicted small lipoprotein YifL